MGVAGTSTTRRATLAQVLQLGTGPITGPGSSVSGDVVSFNGTTGARTAAKGFLDAPVIINGELQTALGGGCHTAFGAHVAGNTLYFFHEKTGQRSLPLTPADLDEPAAAAARILKLLGLP